MLRLVMDEVFGTEQYRNEIIWCRKSSSARKAQSQFNVSSTYIRAHDAVLLYAKDANAFAGIQKNQYTSIPYSERVLNALDTDENGNTVYNRGGGSIGGKSIAEQVEVDIESGMLARSWWEDIPIMRHNSSDNIGYPTQKPEKLLERIIAASSNEGDLVADFFCGSGTLPAVAERLGRKWIATDLGKFAIHTTRKRMIDIQRQRNREGNDFRAFEILNLGRYGRQHFIGVNHNLREEEKQHQLEAKTAEFVALILKAYKAEKVENVSCFHGKRAGRMVVIGPVNLPVTRIDVETIITECHKLHITKADILGFEFEMGLFPNVLMEAKQKGIDLSPKYIPAEVFDKRAVEKDQVVFHDTAAIEVKVKTVKKNTVVVSLTDFSVFYSQDSLKNAERILAEGKSGKAIIVVEHGQVVKIQKQTDERIKREVLTKHWTDWIDYWAIDFNFESKREMIRYKNNETGRFEESWSGDYIFENEWQSFRTRQNRLLELNSAEHTYELASGRKKIAVKVVDIFGNDTMTIVEVSLK